MCVQLFVCVCVFITAVPSTKLFARGGGGEWSCVCITAVPVWIFFFIIAVLTRVLLTRMNAAAGVGCLGYGRVPEVGRPHSWSGDQT